MAGLAASCYPHLFLLLFFNPSISAYTPTTIHFFDDDNCSSLLYTVQTDADANSGSCQSVSGSLKDLSGFPSNSVYPVLADSGCGVTVYSDIANPYCSNGTLAPFGQCTKSSIKSYTVDCSSINGTNTGNYTTSFPSSGETSWPSATSPTTIYSVAATNSLTSTNALLSSSLAASSSSRPSSASSTGTPPSPAPKQSDRNRGLSHAAKIGLGAGLGSGLLAVVVGVWLIWKRRKKSKTPLDATQSGQEMSTTSVSLSEGVVNGNKSQSDVFSYANESFQSLPRERQGKLYN